MKKRNFIRKTAAWLSALAMLTGAVPALDLNAPEISVSASDTGSRILVDLNKNDGRKASYARNANNWIVVGETSATTTINGVSLELSASGGSLRMENNKKLQKQSLEYSYLTMDGATVDTTGGGTLTLKISGLSNGTHTVKTYHSATGNESVSGISVSASGGTSQSGISCPNQVKNPDDAGIGYVTFTGTSTTITIKASSGNAWLNAFEIDGGDPIKGVNHVYPEDQELHHLREEGLSWKAGSGAASHNVYIGTSCASVENATTSSPEFKGSQTGTTYALDETYQSYVTYYWRVDTVDSSGNVIKGSVNSFNVARLAFPTAEGYGRFARGGQGGVVVHVTNLKDDGSEGSLRWALCDAKWQTADWRGVPRIVVFDVGGVIELTDTLCIPDNAGQVYIAGQTAPGDGITLIKHDFGAMGTSDVIIRDIRVRVGDSNGVSTGGMGLASCNNAIVDHCSISWATDEGFSSRNAANITFQWNIIGESLNESVHYNADNRNETEPHSFAASIGGYTGSYHHNLLIDCTGRNWSLAGAMEQDAVTYGGHTDIRNNVVYNWRDRTTDGGVRRLNFVNNYYKAGEVSNTNMHVVSIDGNELNTSDMQKMYVSGNMMVAKNGSVLLASTDNAWDKGKAVSGGKNSTNADVRSDSPFFESYVNTQSAEDAYKSVIAGVGAGGGSAAGWDYIDSRYINEVSKTTYTFTGSKAGLKGIIDSQNDAGGYPSSSNFAHSSDGVCNAANDTDRDGMPNTWEEAHGLNPNDASDGSINSLSPDGYTNVEMFLNELCGDEVNYGEPPVIGKTGAVIDTAHKYTITNVGSGLPLAAAGSVAEAGTDVQQTKNGADGWTLEDAGNGYYRVYSELGDGKTYLLDLAMGDPANGTNIGIWTDTACDAQLFKFVDNGDGTYTICTKATADESGLGIASGSTEDGASVIQWACDGTDNQKWTLTIKVDPISGRLVQDLIVKDLTYNKDRWNYKDWALDTETAAGDLVYGDRDATYVTLPEEVLGGEHILTACDHKFAAGTLAAFTAGADMTVYAAFDQRVAAAPAWLSGWTLTDLTAVNSNDVTFVFYAKEVKAGDTVTLGENGQSASCVNYTVFAAEAKAAETTTEPTEATAAPTETTAAPTETTAAPTETTPEPTETTTSEQPDVTPTLCGDANCDGAVSIADVLALNRNLMTGEKLTEQGALNADTDGDGKPTSADAMNILKHAIGIIKSLPL
ncbi:MAG: RICIN domain-containing protein [Oscillospiraceae bacterium]|nr:RICIN domain-containing protein [Oscillospiraceae bacterium]